MSRYLILIGNSEYDDSYYPRLDFVRNDMNELGRFLTEYGEFEGVFSFQNCKYDNIKKFITIYKENLKPEDDLFFYFSGHGEIDKRTNKLHLVCRDTEYRFLGATSIDSDTLYNFLNYNKAKSKVVILDCCHSGAIIDSKSGVSGNISTKDFDQAQQQFLGNAKGTFMITSSKRTQQSYKSVDKSIFTECILNGLKDDDTVHTESNTIRLTRLWEYIVDKIDTNKQTPLIYNQSEGNIYISKAPLKLVENQKEIKRSMVKDMVRNAINELTKGNNSIIFAPKDISNIILEENPDYNKSNTVPEIARDCVNLSTRRYYSGDKQDLYYRVEKAKYRLYDKSKDGIWDSEGNQIINIIEKSVLIKINKSYYEGMNEDEIYKATKGNWKLSIERAEKAEYVF
ncbi:MAG: caspase family protein, partial [Clostridiales bacterium]